MASYTGPWAPPIVLVVEKRLGGGGGGGGGGIRFCIIDFRSFNQNTLKDAQPFSRIDETLDALDGASDFSTFSFSQWLLAG